MPFQPNTYEAPGCQGVSEPDSVEEILGAAEARHQELLARLRVAEPVEAVGVVESITGFGRQGEESMSILPGDA